jgi:transaldolase
VDARCPAESPAPFQNGVSVYKLPIGAKLARNDIDALVARLQDEGAKPFVNSWNDLMGVIGSKSATLQMAS